MRIFITGASGFIGSQVVSQLLDAGHALTGLARSDGAAAKLAARGLAVVRGDIADVDILQRGARDADATVHCAFSHDDMTKFLENAAVEERALDAFVEALAGSNKPLVISSGVLGLVNEGDRPSFAFPRIAAMLRALDASARGIRTSLVRNAPVTHGPNDVHGFIPTLIAIARAKGIAGYVGDGETPWPACDVRDTARLYRLALEKAPPGSALHAVGDAGITTRTIAEAIGARLGVPARAVDDPDAHFGPFFARVMTMGARANNQITRELVGWSPTHPGLLDDLAHGDYFATVTTTGR